MGHLSVRKGWPSSENLQFFDLEYQFDHIKNSAHVTEYMYVTVIGTCIVEKRNGSGMSQL
jgi:hypothetical protein